MLLCLKESTKKSYQAIYSDYNRVLNTVLLGLPKIEPKMGGPFQSFEISKSSLFFWKLKDFPRGLKSDTLLFRLVTRNRVEMLGTFLLICTDILFFLADCIHPFKRTGALKSRLPKTPLQAVARVMKWSWFVCFWYLKSWFSTHHTVHAFVCYNHSGKIWKEHPVLSFFHVSQCPNTPALFSGMARDSL